MALAGTIIGYLLAGLMIGGVILAIGLGGAQGCFTNRPTNAMCGNSNR